VPSAHGDEESAIVMSQVFRPFGADGGDIGEPFMDIRTLRRRSLLILAFCAAPLVLRAQESSKKLEIRTPAPLVVRGAKAEALSMFGLTADIGSSDSVVSHAIYVKLRKGVPGAVLPEAELGSVVGRNIAAPPQVPDLARRVGVSVLSATRIPLTLIPLDQKVRQRARTLSAGAYAAAVAAEEDLSRIIEIRYEESIHPREAARRLMRLPDVEYAEPIFIPRLLAPVSPNDPQIWRQSSLPQVRAYDAWDVWSGDTTTVIGIDDAGIDLFHEDLAPNIQENPGEAGLDALGRDKRSNGVDDDGNGVVDDWHGANLTAGEDGSQPGNTKGSAHGTAVAGIAAAATNNGIGIAGVANRCRFFPIKAGRNDNGALTQAYEGIIYAARRGFKVLNCSWGEESRSQVLQDLVTNLVLAYDIAIVAGGGNDVKYANFYPAGYRHVMGVGAVGSDDRFTTTWGEHIAISAPAGYTTTDNDAYTDVGPVTSFTTPFAAGGLALVRSRFPALTADQAMAHLRLTADNIDGRNADKVGFIGYGRLNIYRAVTIDPFSHPGVALDTLLLSDLQGVPREDFSVGDRGLIRLRLTNLLGDATNLRISVTAYGEGAATVTIGSDTILVPVLKRGDTVTPEVGIPFEILAQSDTRVRLRIDIVGDEDYADYTYDRALFSKPYITVSTPDITASLTSRGRIGFHDYPDNTIGRGFRFRGTDFLYEGGVMIASDTSHLVDNIRGSNASMEGSDFVLIGYPTAENDSTITLSDSAAPGERRIGLELRMRFVASDTVPNAIGVELRARNVGTKMLDSLRVATFMDWDVDAAPYNQQVEYKGSAGDEVPLYGTVTSQSGFSVASGLAGPVDHPIFYAIRNDQAPVDIYDGFTPAEKWRTLGNGIGSAFSGPGDISLVIGKVVVGLAPGAEDTTLFLFGVTTPEREGIDAVRRLVGGRTSGVASVGRTGDILGTPRPNPFNRQVTFEAFTAGTGATLRVYNLDGAEVADLSDRLPSDDSPVSITFDGSSLPSGFYYIRFVSGSQTETRQLLLVK